MKLSLEWLVLTTVEELKQQNQHSTVDLMDAFQLRLVYDYILYIEYLVLFLGEILLDLV